MRAAYAAYDEAAEAPDEENDEAFRALDQASQRLMRAEASTLAGMTALLRYVAPLLQKAGGERPFWFRATLLGNNLRISEGALCRCNFLNSKTIGSVPFGHHGPGRFASMPRRSIRTSIPEANLFRVGTGLGGTLGKIRYEIQWCGLGPTLQISI
jgi:hypothetical protein